jgi:hypothetical protein
VTGYKMKDRERNEDIRGEMGITDNNTIMKEMGITAIKAIIRKLPKEMATVFGKNATKPNSEAALSI